MSEVSFIPVAFIMELIHPPMNHPDRILKEIFLDVSESQGYSSFQLVGGRAGAILSSGDKRRCEIRSDRLVIREDRTELSFLDFASQGLDLVDAIRKKIPLPVFLTTSITIRSLSPAISVDKNTIQLLVEKCWKPPVETFGSFQRRLGGLGFRMVFPPTKEDRSEVQMRIEPSFGDNKMFFLEVQYRFFHPHQAREELERACQSAYDFLSRQVAEFLVTIQKDFQ